MALRERGFLPLSLAALGLLLLIGCGSSSPAAQLASSLTGEVVTVYLTPNCGCCVEYIRYLRSHGAAVHVVQQDDLTPLKRAWGIPESMWSCHTSRLGPYVIEGHVPLEAIVRLWAERPDARGIALPGMPPGSPGMSGNRTGPLTIYLLTRDGRAHPWMEW
ncbi:DUF411 domain-containing protein [Thermoflexus sp.]|uniref:DUF411 domain-containing protein n=1 Tax=Thermoflexus sp. TaxID=1969742 RepID=UPI0025CBD2B7|nr:DUF411 domain-containing protein [Thermoflexus sp.]MCS6963677.1 hypothetical protein [Thermoflexus sp.]MCX7690460.1 hypothetical protein [Thermoflexus sp.]MDW8184820.1 DUF411 domain-containing protein [Anaerolineae bacterium]